MDAIARAIHGGKGMIRITLESGASVILCEKCWKKLTHILDEIDFNDVLKTLKKKENADE